MFHVQEQVCIINQGQTATFALKKTKRSSIRKGMVLLGKTLQPPVATFEFEAEVLVLYHSSTINTKYQTMLHVGSVRQTAQIVGMDRVVLRTGDRAIVRFRFIMNPEYVKLGTRLIFREGRCKGIEKIVRLLTQEEPLLLPENISNAERESLSRAAELSVYENGRMIRKGKKRTVRKM